MTATQLPRTASATGPVQPLTRTGIWILFWLAAANGLFLYLAPGLADTDYAWSIKHMLRVLKEDFSAAEKRRETKLKQSGAEEDEERRKCAEGRMRKDVMEVSGEHGRAWSSFPVIGHSLPSPSPILPAHALDDRLLILPSLKPHLAGELRVYADQCV